MLESEGISRRQVKSSKPTNNIADGLFRTIECIDKTMQRKIFACLQNMNLVSSNACNTFFQCSPVMGLFKASYHSIQDTKLNRWVRIVNKTHGGHP